MVCGHGVRWGTGKQGKQKISVHEIARNRESTGGVQIKRRSGSFGGKKCASTDVLVVCCKSQLRGRGPTHARLG